MRRPSDAERTARVADAERLRRVDVERGVAADALGADVGDVDRDVERQRRSNATFQVWT